MNCPDHPPQPTRRRRLLRPSRNEGRARQLPHHGVLGAVFWEPRRCYLIKQIAVLRHTVGPFRDATAPGPSGDLVPPYRNPMITAKEREQCKEQPPCVPSWCLLPCNLYESSRAPRGFSGVAQERRHSCRPESRASAKACLPGRRRQADKNACLSNGRQVGAPFGCGFAARRSLAAIPPKPHAIPAFLEMVFDQPLAICAN